MTVLNPHRHHVVTACRCCGSESLVLVLPLPPTPVGDDYRRQAHLDLPQPSFALDVYLCRGCGLAQLLTVVDPELLYGHMIYRTAVSLGLDIHFGHYVDEVLSRTGTARGDTVVDIGSNDGTLLGAFQARGMKVLGIEPSPAIAAEANAKGIDTVCRYFGSETGHELRRERGPVGLITCNNTLANIPDLGGFAGGLRALLAPMGVLTIETGYALDLVAGGLFDNIYHEHLTYFAVKPLVLFFRRHGLEVFDVQRVPTKGGSIRLYAQLLDAGRPVSGAVADVVRAEENAGLYTPEPYGWLDQRLSAARTRIEKELGALKAAGKRLVGYGASVGTTTFVERLGLGPFLEAMVDDNPAKHGTFSPGTHLEVRPSDDLYAGHPDGVVVLSWRYAEPIMARHRRYAEQGGRFIHVWPDVRV